MREQFAKSLPNNGEVAAAKSKSDEAHAKVDTAIGDKK